MITVFRTPRIGVRVSSRVGDSFTVADIKTSIAFLEAHNAPHAPTGEHMVAWLRAGEFKLEDLRRAQLVDVCLELGYTQDEVRGKGIVELRGYVAERL